MPFVKGRQKTGGRTKKSDMPVPARKSTRFVDRLNDNGFDFHKELAVVLKELRDLRKSGVDAVRAAELKFYYGELKSLLPFMAPKLKEKEVEVVEPSDAAPLESSLSTEDILEAINGKETKTDKRASGPDPLEKRSIELLPKASSETNLQDLAIEQEEE